MGASNELPESEELDALYDRFLIRREVRQVSTAGLTDLLADPQLAETALREEASAPSTAGNGAGAAAVAEASGILDMSQQLFSSVRQAPART